MITYIPQIILSIFFANTFNNYAPKSILVFLVFLEFLFSILIIIAFLFDMTWLALFALFCANICAFLLNLSMKTIMRYLCEGAKLRWANARLKQFVAVARMVGPVSGGLLLSTIGDYWSASVVSFVLFIAVIDIFMIRIDNEVHKKEDIPFDRKQFNASNWFQTNLKAKEILISNTVAYFSIGAILSVFMFYLSNQLKLEEWKVGFIYTLSGVGSLITSTWVVHRFKKNINYPFAFLIFAFSLCFLGISNLWVVIFSYLIYNIAAMALEIESSTYIQMLSSKENISLVLGYYNAITTIAIPVGMLTAMSASYFVPSNYIIASSGVVLLIFIAWRRVIWRTAFHTEMATNNLAK